MKKLHASLAQGFDHLFSVNDNVSESGNIGKYCIFNNPQCTNQRENIFVIGSLQRDYTGALCYRVYRESGDDFGTVARFSDVTIIDVPAFNMN